MTHRLNRKVMGPCPGNVQAEASGWCWEDSCSGGGVKGVSVGSTSSLLAEGWDSLCWVWSRIRSHSFFFSTQHLGQFKSGFHTYLLYVCHYQFIRKEFFNHRNWRQKLISGTQLIFLGMPIALTGVVCILWDFTRWFHSYRFSSCSVHFQMRNPSLWQIKELLCSYWVADCKELTFNSVLFSLLCFSGG